MKQASLIFITLLSLFALYSCEGYSCGHGIVKDKATGLPLDSVLCTATTGSKSMFTDSTGSFNLCNDMGGCMPCKDLVVQFSKTGYKTISQTNPLNAVIYMER